MAAPALLLPPAKYIRIVDKAPVEWDESIYAHATRMMNRAVPVGDCLEYPIPITIRFPGWTMAAMLPVQLQKVLLHLVCFGHVSGGVTGWI